PRPARRAELRQNPSDDATLEAVADATGRRLWRALRQCSYRRTATAPMNCGEIGLTSAVVDRWPPSSLHDGALSRDRYSRETLFSNRLRTKGEEAVLRAMIGAASEVLNFGSGRPR